MNHLKHIKLFENFRYIKESINFDRIMTDWRRVGLDNCFLLDPANHECIVENEQLKLVVQAGLNYPYLQLYIPPHRKSIAIENLI